MIRSIIDTILPTIELLNFADRVAGIALPVSRKILDDGNQTVTKVFPVYKNTPEECEGGDYIILTPDDKFKSVIYFEEISSNIESQTNHEYKLIHDIRSVGWFNLKKINKTVESDTLLRLILQAMPQSLTVIQETALDVFNVQIRLTGIENKSPQLFSSYTYDEAETQYLIFPYDYGALRFTVTYSMNKCVDDITITPNCGKK